MVVKSSSDERGKKRIRAIEHDDDDDNDDYDGDDKREKRRIRAVKYSSDDDDNESPLSDNELMPERPERQKRTNKIFNNDTILNNDNNDGFLTDRSLTESDANESLTEDNDEAFEVSEDDNRSLSEDEVLIK
ncbi:hypothetical protein C1646_776177 [Rhizophagus diaphanus]|nr:hypothetical protein C1646_776177 [Rhizophagus diaphanus] [Rhizophagus sp. MUCL 43196]